MTPEEIKELLMFLDGLFQLGGKLITAAHVKAPQLNLELLPTLQEMDQARAEALDRVSKT